MSTADIALGWLTIAANDVSERGRLGSRSSSSLCNESITLTKTVTKLDERQVETIRTEISQSETTTDYRSGNGQSAWHHRHHLLNVHGILNVIGWGTLLPIGMIIARYFRKPPTKCDEWYSLHVSCQILGYLLGTMGGLICLLSGKSSKDYNARRPHIILSIIIFTLATIQMFLGCLRGQRETKCRKACGIYHRLLGYVLIGLSVANSLVGIESESNAGRWRWVYGSVLLVLVLLAIGLEINKRLKLNNNNNTNNNNNNNI
ncbi:hypothetical protein ACFE04_016034 [Oxalis oulophora]